MNLNEPDLSKGVIRGPGCSTPVKEIICILLEVDVGKQLSSCRIIFIIPDNRSVDESR